MFTHNNPASIYLFPKRATCPAHLTLLDFITLKCIATKALKKTPTGQLPF
jgi:hypothetical protein